MDTGHTVCENGSIEDNSAGTSLENIEEEVPEICSLTQDVVNEPIKGFIASLTRQLEELNRLAQGKVTIQHPSHYPRTDYSSTSGTAAYQPNRQIERNILLFTLQNIKNVCLLEQMPAMDYTWIIIKIYFQRFLQLFTFNEFSLSVAEKKAFHAIFLHILASFLQVIDILRHSCKYLAFHIFDKSSKCRVPHKIL